jgi:hypothetical protein
LIAVQASGEASGPDKQNIASLVFGQFGRRGSDALPRRWDADAVKLNPPEIVLATTGFAGKLCGSLLNFYGTHL